MYHTYEYICLYVFHNLKRQQQNFKFDILRKKTKVESLALFISRAHSADCDTNCYLSLSLKTIDFVHSSI